MNKVIMLIILVLGSAFVSAQAYEDEGVIAISFVNQDPDPVEPGDYVELRWKIENLGELPLEDIVIELNTKFPFSLDPGEDATKTINSLDGFQKSDSGYITKYKVRVSENAVEGTNTVELKYKVGKSSYTTLKFDIDVETVDANLGIVSVETTPSTVLPGNTFDLQIKVRNMADSVLKDVSVKLDTLLSSITAGTATTTSKSEILDAVPFAPLKSATEKKIRNIQPGSEVVFSYNLIAYPNAEAKVYKVPLELTFFDSLGTEYNENDVIGIVVSAQPDLSVILDSTDISKAASTGEVTVKFVNKGLTDVKFVNVNLGKSSDYDIKSADEVYMGNIDSDDYETADFDLFVKANNGSIVMLPVHYEYMDANNNKFSQDIELELKLCKKGDPGCANGENSKTGIIIAVVVLVVIGFLIFRAIRKRKKK